jgi:hypothetical protein
LTNDRINLREAKLELKGHIGVFEVYYQGKVAPILVCIDHHVPVKLIPWRGVNRVPTVHSRAAPRLVLLMGRAVITKMS